MESLIGIFAVVLSLSVPIVAIIGILLFSYNKYKKESEIKKAIIENNVDSEIAKLLITERPHAKERRHNSTLQAACILIGLGVGYGSNIVLGINQAQDQIGFIIILAVGVGIGLLTSFFITNMLDKKKTQDK